MHHRAKDLTGQRFGRLTCISYAGSNGAKSMWLARCDCGTEKIFIASELKKGRTNSCGCLARELASKRLRTHGMSGHPAFWVWRSMNARCRLPSHQAWANYGGRGIVVCPEWQDSFEAFWKDMGPTYQPELWLDRVDNNGPYTRDNCRWATSAVQNANRRNNVFIETPWGRMIVEEASRKSGINVTTLLYRIDHDCPADRLFDAPDFANRFTTS